MARETVLDKFVIQYLFRGDERALGRIERRVQVAKERLDKLSVGAGIAGAAFTGALVKIGKTVLSFETEINALAAATNAPQEEMARLRELAMQLGETTQFSASQAASAMKLLGQAGLSTTEIIEGIPGVLDLAAAGQLDMATAADQAVSVLRAYGKEVSDLTRINDLLAVSAASAKTTVRDMGVAVAKAAPTASKLGISIETTAASVATLQNNGLAAEEAGTAFRNVMMRLMNVTGPAKDAFDQMGLSIEETQKLLREGRMDEIMNNFRQAGFDAFHASAIFGARSATAALILAGQKKSLEDLYDAYENADGAAKRMAITQMTGLPGAIRILQSKLESLMLRLGDAGITAAIMAMSKAIVDLISWFQSLDPRLQSLVAYVIAAGPLLLGFAAAWRLIIFAMSPISKLLRFIFVGILGVGKSSKVATPGLIGFGVASKISSIGIRILGRSILALLGPFGLLWLAISYADVLLPLLWKAVKGWIIIFKSLWAFITGGWRKTWAAVVGAIDNAVTWVGEKARGFFGAIGQGALDAFAWIEDNWLELLKFLFLPQLQVFAWLRDAFDWAMRGLIDLIPGPIKRFLGIDDVPEDFKVSDAISEGVKDAGSGLVKDITKIAQAARDRLPFSNARVGPLSDLTESGRRLIGTLAEGVRQAAPGLNHAMHAAIAPGLARIAAPLPVGPPASSFGGLAHAGAGAGTGTQNTMSVRIEKIEINAPGADAQEVAQSVGAVLRDQLDTMVYDSDSRIAR